MTTRAMIDALDFKAADIFFRALVEFYDLSGRVGLDMFARDGSLTVCRYHRFLPAIDLWELNPEHEHALKRFLPRNLRIGCSYASMEHCEECYGLIVVDTPQGLYPDGQGVRRAEHFDVVRTLGRIMDDKCIVVLYVNQRPYNRDEVGVYGRDDYGNAYDFSAWMELRREFYYGSDGRDVSEEVAIRTYRHVFTQQGFDLKTVLLTPCYSDMEGLPPSFRLALDLVKR